MNWRKLKLDRFPRLLILFALILVSSTNLVVPTRADSTCSTNQPCYFGYDTSGIYVPFPSPFPSYWQTKYNGQQVKVTTAVITISTQGFPSDYSTDLIVDGKTVGSIAGGGTAKFQIKGDDVHSFQVSSYVNGKTGERFFTKSSSWTSEKGKEVDVTTYNEVYVPYYDWWYTSYGYTYYWYYYYPYYVPNTQKVIQPFDQSYTFRYETHYQLTVQDDFGGGVSQSGWYTKDSTVSLDTKPIVQTSADTRYAFVAWTINGQDVNNEHATINMDKTYSAIAKYQKQFFVDVRSDFGNPTGSGWYDEGSKARIQIEKELPLNGILGALGAKRVFDHWNVGGSSNNIADVTVDSPKPIVGIWREDYTVPLVIVALLALGIVGLIFIRSPERFGQTVQRVRGRRGKVEEAGLEEQEDKRKEERRTEEDPILILEKEYAKNPKMTHEEFLQRKDDILEAETERKTRKRTHHKETEDDTEGVN